ncbi:hypothetical protein CEUSTIGMA_g2814.t1 [Chlamydomonas eustigma]|uniref:GTPase Der n=1 Tax=Chlamydomonas eustigma TaxID=1157962 RepID=A0A250WXW7_9CHLO|nr:hypothetical protein CEUSTIGMA_g2814.t1 [Chlamydomonas eustigma]|eukprot:GAX75370.1 hypothetical protein CEUSTIGMA_g2814.t1 [Chlamydomonas eustigma]
MIKIIKALVKAYAIDFELLRTHEPCVASKARTCFINNFSSSFSVEPISEHLLPQVAIIGKPNVGKSALFNRLLRRRVALVYDTPESHVTRDYKEGIAKLGDLRFRLVDTSGLEPQKPQHTIQGRAVAITSRILKKSDLILFVIDARDGVLARDEELGQWLKRLVGRDKVLVVANKAENQKARQGMSLTIHDAYRLGFGEPVAVSATSGEGMVDLYQAVQPWVEQVDSFEKLKNSVHLKDESESSEQEGMSQVDPRVDSDYVDKADSAETEPWDGSAVRMAILGQPNVGKSTLLNALAKEQRAMTGPEPGLTRDSVRASLLLKGGLNIEIVDTAGWVGITKTPKYDDVGGSLASMARNETAKALAACHVAVLVLDAERAVQMQRVMTQRELSLAGLVLSKGRALVIAANKIDVLSPSDRSLYLETLQSTLQERFLEAGTLHVVGMSALAGQGVERLLPVVQEVYTAWSSRVSTGALNRFVKQLQNQMHAKGSGAGGAAHRIKYMTQVRSRPPSFAGFLSGSQQVGEEVVRFIASQLREGLNLHGVPVRLWFRYKETRASNMRAAHSRRGRPLALRGGKSQRSAVKRMKVMSDSRQRISFFKQSKDILGKLASEGFKPFLPSSAEGEKEKKAEGASQQRKRDDVLIQGTDPYHSKVFSEEKSEMANDEEPSANAKSRNMARRNTPPLKSISTFKNSSKADLIARMLSSRKPGAAHFLIKSKHAQRN